MFFANKIKELREEQQLLQRHLSAALEIDTPMYSKLERGERKAKREYVVKMAAIFKVDADELLALWLAGQVYDLVKEEAVAKQALQVVNKNI